MAPKAVDRRSDTRKCLVYPDVVYKAAGIDTTMMHSGLPQKQKSELAGEFNDPKSSLKVLVLLYDVTAASLNLYRACSNVFLTTIARNFSLTKQVIAGTYRVYQL